jgi:hypothetical protein
MRHFSLLIPDTMKKLLVLSVSLFPAFLNFATAQKITEGHWGQQGYDIAYSAAATDDGGYIITGLTQSGTDTVGDIIVIKTNADGDTMWTFRYGGPKLEGGNNVIQTTDGGYMVSGHTEDFGADDCDAFMMKLDKGGRYEWLKVYGGEFDDVCAATLEMPDGYIFTGVTASYGNGGIDGNRHVYFVRTNGNGDTTWTRYYAGRGIDYSYSIAAMPKGGFLAAGYSTSFGSQEQGWLLRLKDNGDTLWTRRYPNGGNTRLYKVLPATDNGYIVAGYTSTCVSCNLQGLIIKLDADGKEVWQKTVSNDNDMIIFHDVAQLSNGDLMFAGTSANRYPSGSEKEGAYIYTTDLNGIKITDTLYGGKGAVANAIALQGNNSYLVAGGTYAYGDNLGDIYYMEMNNTISGVASVKEPWPHLYPNPMKARPAVLVLPAAEANQQVCVDIINMDGKLISSQENILSKNIIINPALLPAGNYLYRVSCKDGKVFKGKFVVE